MYIFPWLTYNSKHIFQGKEVWKTFIKKNKEVGRKRGKTQFKNKNNIYIYSSTLFLHIKGGENYVRTMSEISISHENVNFAFCMVLKQKIQSFMKGEQRPMLTKKIQVFL